MKKPKYRRLYTEEEVIENIKNFYKKHGRVPLLKEIKNPSGNFYIRRYGSWNAAVKLAGFTTTQHRKHIKHEEYSKDFLLNEIKRFYEKHERVPAIRDTLGYNAELPHYLTYRNRFGSWNKALRLAGLEPFLCTRHKSIFKKLLTKIRKVINV